MPHPDATALARRLRRSQTPAETAAWEILRDRRCLGLKFRRQVVVYGFVADFYCAELKLAIELVGGVHGTPDVIAYDRARAEHLWRHGVVVETIPNELLSPTYLERCIARHRSAPPLHERGEGAGG